MRKKILFLSLLVLIPSFLIGKGIKNDQCRRNSLCAFFLADAKTDECVTNNFMVDAFKTEQRSDTVPTFPGGKKNFYRFIETHFKWPRTIVPDYNIAPVPGIFVAQFTVGEGGKISNFQFLRSEILKRSWIYSDGVSDNVFSTDKRHAEESIKSLIKLMPRWIPGKKDDGSPSTKTVKLRVINFDNGISIDCDY